MAGNELCLEQEDPAMDEAACVGHIGYGIVGTMGAFTAVAMTDGSTYATAVA